MTPTATMGDAAERPTCQRGLPDRSGMAQYIVLIRGPGDPERRSREDRRRADAAGATTSWRKLVKLSASEWAARIVAHLGDGVPRTFNRIMVELADVTADVVAGKSPEKGLWLAVKDGLIAWTAAAPVYFIAEECSGQRPPSTSGIEDKAPPSTGSVEDNRRSAGRSRAVQLALDLHLVGEKESNHG